MVMPASDDLQIASATDELARLIATLHATELSISVLTKGQVDTVANSEGHTYLLRQAQEQLRRDTAAKNAEILDALPAHVALLDADGLIIAINHAWHTFASDNGYLFGGDGQGTNYFDVCSHALGADQNSAQMAAAGIHAVIAGSVKTYSQEYPCHSPNRPRWFQLVVTPIEGVRPGGVVVMHVDITSQRLAEGESTELQRRFTDLMMNMELASVMLDAEGRVTFCNDYLLRLTGWSRDEVIGNDWFQQFIPAADRALRIAFRRLLDSGDASGFGQYENHILTRAGDARLMRWSNCLQRSGSGQVIGTASIGEDITKQRLAETRVRHLSRVQRVLSGINTLIVRVNDYDTLYNGACRIAVEGGGFRIAMLILVDAVSGAMQVVASAGKDEGLVAQINSMLANPEGAAKSMTALAVRQRTAMVSNDVLNDSRLGFSDLYQRSGVRSLAACPLVSGQNVVGAFVLCSGEVDFFHTDEMLLLSELTDDIAFAMDHIEKSERLTYLSFYDALTGLPNAQLFQDQLDRYIAAARQDEAQVCVIVLDLDGFTDVNRMLGRQVGDGLLREVAARLRHDLLEPFALGRTAADTFAVAAPSRTALASDRLRDCTLGALRESFLVAGKEIRITGKAGIAVFPEDGDDGRTVLQNAESALKRAKDRRQSFVYYSHTLNTLAAARLALESELRIALDDNQFRVHYQPRVDMARGGIVGAEALIRWQHPTRGLLAPGEFIELAEETGLIVQIGAWTLRAVCVQQAAWIAAGVSAVPVAVNVSAIQFEQGDLLQVIRDALLASALDARMLHIELTETAVMRDPDAAAAVLHAARALGVELALDDFGTGYSSLASLKRYPFSAVKIDRSFVTHITSNVEDAAIASAIIAMAHGLRLKVVAEGIETEGQFNYLRSQGCDEMQGYLFSRPVEAEAFEQLLRSGTRMPLPDVADASKPTLLLVDVEPGIRSVLTRSLL